MRVKDLMKPDPITLKLDDKLQDLVDKFSTYEIGSVIIINEKREPFQIITLRDIAKICFLQLFPSSITEVLKALNKNKKSLITIYHLEPFIEALNLMEKFNISHLPVINKNNKLVGILSLRDIVKTVPEIIYLDPLTEVNNRSYLDLLKTKLKRIRGCVSILMVDIDNFKNVNDNYGHTIGDKVLKRIAQTLRKNIKITDEVIRYGGEEFLIIAYRCGLEDGKKLGERLRKKIEKIKFKDIPGLRITVSIGITFYEPKKEFLEAVEEADKAMYQAKKLGKNRISIYQEIS
ncbi:MAG: GGDEF domain [Thermodesulfobacteria bacterium]|nr:GGDEF domain-containing protein [Thermodesulfobacteriota bacterium]MCU4138102.1 GGDEF domain [Thermodesulfobacteriota bacterium]